MLHMRYPYTYLAGTALARVRAAQVVHNDISTPGSEEQSIGLAQATACTGDNDGLAVKTKLRHCCG